MMPPTTTTTSSRPAAASWSITSRHEREVRTGEHREPEGVGVLLDDGRHDLLRRLVQPRVDDLEARVAQRPGDDLRAPVVAVEARFADDDAVGAVHGARA